MASSLPPGFTVDETSQVHDTLPEGFQLNEDKFGGLGGELKAGALGAARGATLGLSDVALTKSGLVNPHTVQGLQEENPISSFAGETAGVVGSALLGNEAAPVNLIGKAGKATYMGVKALDAAKLAQEGTLAAKVLGATGDIAAHAAGSAVEGAAFAGIGNTLNEYAIGDPGLNGEKIMDNFEKGALWGGALGASLKAAAIGLPPAVTAAKEGMVSLRNTLIGTGENGSAGLVGKISPESKFTEAIGHRTTNLDTNQQTELLNNVTEQLNQVHNNTQTALKDLNQSLRPKEIDALIDTSDPNKVMGAVNDIHGAMTDAVAKMDANPALYSTNAAAKIRDHIEQLENKMEGWGSTPMFEGKDVPSSVFTDLKDIKQSLGNWGHGIMDVTKGDTKRELTGLSSMIGDKLKDPEIFGEVGSRYAAHDDVLKNIYDFIGPNGKPTPKLSPLMTNSGTRTKPNFQFDSTKIGRMFKTTEETSGQMKANNLNDFYDVLKGLPDHLEDTHANVPNDMSFGRDELRQMIEKSQQTVGESGKKYLEAVKSQKGSLGLKDYLAATVAFSHPVAGAAYEAYNIATKPFQYMNSLAQVERLVGKTTAAIGKGAESIFTPALKAIGKSKGAILPNLSSDNHEDTAKSLAQLSNDPGLMINRLNAATGDLHGIAPDTTASLQQAMIRASQFLQSKMPGQGQDNPFEDKPTPSQTEIAKFNSYLSIVNKPSSVFDLMRNKTLGPEAIETLSTVYPKLYDHMKQAMLQEMTKKLQAKETIPYDVKQQISFFMGQPVSSSMNPQSILANQMALSPPPQMAPQGKPSKDGMGKITLADRTGVQAARDKA